LELFQITLRENGTLPGGLLIPSQMFIESMAILLNSILVITVSYYRKVVLQTICLYNNRVSNKGIVKGIKEYKDE